MAVTTKLPAAKLCLAACVLAALSCVAVGSTEWLITGNTPPVTSTQCAQIDVMAPDTWPQSLKAFLDSVSRRHAPGSYARDEYKEYSSSSSSYDDESYSSYSSEGQEASYGERSGTHYNSGGRLRRYASGQHSSLPYEDDDLIDYLPAKQQAAAGGRNKAASASAAAAAAGSSSSSSSSSSREGAEVAGAAAGFDYTRHGGAKLHGKNKDDAKYDGEAAEYSEDGGKDKGEDEDKDVYKWKPWKKLGAKKKDSVEWENEQLVIVPELPVGPTGPAGPAGPRGPHGVAGPPGPPGQNATEHVTVKVFRGAFGGPADAHVITFKANHDTTSAANGGSKKLGAFPPTGATWSTTVIPTGEYIALRANNNTKVQFLTLMVAVACNPGYTFTRFNAGANPYLVSGTPTPGPWVTDLLIQPSLLPSPWTNDVPTHVVYVQVPLYHEAVNAQQVDLGLLYQGTLPDYVLSVQFECVPNSVGGKYDKYADLTDDYGY